MARGGIPLKTAKNQEIEASDFFRFKGSNIFSRASFLGGVTKIA
jgi:hypothetical protein